MKRMHVYLSVEELSPAISFYSELFATPPSVVKPDYAKWMLDDPRVNFAISTRGRQAGLDHLGIQVDDQEELRDVYARLQKAGEIMEEGHTTCCYAKSEKAWIEDGGHLVGGVPHLAGEHRLRHKHRTRCACCAREGLLRRSAGPIRDSSLLHRVGPHARASDERPLPVHWKLRTFDHGRGHPQSGWARSFPRILSW